MGEKSAKNKACHGGVQKNSRALTSRPTLGGRNLRFPRVSKSNRFLFTQKVTQIFDTHKIERKCHQNQRDVLNAIYVVLNL